MKKSILLLFIHHIMISSLITASERDCSRFEVVKILTKADDKFLSLLMLDAKTKRHIAFKIDKTADYVNPDLKLCYLFNTQNGLSLKKAQEAFLDYPLSDENYSEIID